MKTIELKWIEDEDQTVAQDAFVGLQELIDDGVFPDLKAKEEDGYLYLTGEKDVLDKVVMKLQKDYAKYGQIMIKENKKDAEAVRVESYDDNLQDIFNHTVKEFEDVKKNVKSENYITNLGKYEMRFKKLKEAAKGKDKSLIQNYLDEIATLTESAEVKKIKPFKKISEDSLDDMIDNTGRNPERIATKGFSGYIPNRYKDCCFTFITKNWRDMDKYGLPEHPVFFPRDPENIDNKWCHHTYLNFKQTLKLFDKVPDKILLVTPRQRCGWSFGNVDGDYVSKDAWIAFAVNFLGIRAPVERKPRKPRDPNKGYKKPDYVNPDMKGGVYKDGTTTVYEMPEDNESFKAKFNAAVMEQLSDLKNWGIVEETPEPEMNESFLSPKELKKKLQRVCTQWASIEGRTFTEVWDELRKKKSVKDMLDFYTVDEIIEDLKKKKKEADDELEDEDKIK